MWSNYQEKVFDFFENGEGHGAVNAVAGSGKSTTAVEAVVRVDIPNTLILAFNKHIEIDFNNKLEERNKFPIARTYNGFAWSILRNSTRTKLDRDKNQNIYRYDVLGKSKENDYWKFVWPLIRVVSILKNSYILPGPDLIKNIYAVVNEFDLNVKEKDLPVFVSYCAEVYRRSVETLNVSDFDDQKFQPVYRNMDFPHINLAVVDEYQDSCPLEGEILKRITPDRLIVFGDPWQAIYSFKGTSADSIAQFIKEYNAKELPLSICYRCPKAVVRHAQTIVPHIEYHPDAPEGGVRTIEYDEYMKSQPTKDDMILARCNVDLVSSAMAFIRENVPAYVKGKEVGDSLTNLIGRITKGRSIPMVDFVPAFRDYRIEETQNLKDRNAIVRLGMFEETCDTIDVLTEGCNNTSAVIRRIETLFTDEAQNGIMHQSIHKSKGGQGKKGRNVYVLRPDKIPHPRSSNLEEEKRIHYVGMTRVQGDGELIYVRKKPETVE